MTIIQKIQPPVRIDTTKSGWDIDALDVLLEHGDVQVGSVLITGDSFDAEAILAAEVRRRAREAVTLKVRGFGA